MKNDNIVLTTGLALLAGGVVLLFVNRDRGPALLQALGDPTATARIRAGG